MSVAHRSIARLPLSIFENLAQCSLPTTKDTTDKEESWTPGQLRAAMVHKLSQFSTQQWYRTVYKSISTVGPLLRLPVTTLVRALDPLLTYGAYKSERK